MDDDIKEFAKDISEKLYCKFFQKQLSLSSIKESVRQMIESKLKKEDWIKIEKH